LSIGRALRVACFAVNLFPREPVMNRRIPRLGRSAVACVCIASVLQSLVGPLAFAAEVNVGGFNVAVRGAVVGGVVKIGTAFQAL
jgi:hypothetical protein